MPTQGMRMVLSQARSSGQEAHDANHRVFLVDAAEQRAVQARVLLAVLGEGLRPRLLRRDDPRLSSCFFRGMNTSPFALPGGGVPLNTNGPVGSSLLLATTSMGTV